ncbi:MAG: MoaD/ThiS family protein [SAR202 cluster bacterium]|nr:MoaD/ThiS family protein [SAR202 cluster bacterium]|tara:strand:+ start:884 stop:1147 length:264 start_codon:yes stop_codon:yes gene_type:complete
MAEVWMSTRMQRFSGGLERVQVLGATVRQIVNNLEQEYPGMKDVLCINNEIDPAIAVVIDGETSNLGMLDKVSENSEVHFIPAMAGG